MKAKFRWNSAAAMSPDLVRLVKTGDVWANGEAMTYDATRKCYVIEIDSTDGALFGGTGYDPEVTYEVMHNTATTLYDEVPIIMGTIQTDLETHVSDTSAHGVAGAVVGTSDAQTLSNKVIDGDDNTIRDVSFASMKANTIAPAHSVKPTATAGDGCIHIVDADATSATIECSESTKTTAKTMKLTGTSVKVQNKAGAAIKITNVTPGASAGEVAEYSQIAAIDTRLNALEVGGPFTGGSIAASVAVTGYDDGTKDAFGLRVQYTMDATNVSNPRHWEIFWRPGVFDNPPAAGVISDEDLATLRGGGNDGRVRMSERSPIMSSTCYLQVSRGTYSVIVVAFDSTGVKYVSSPAVANAEIGGANRPAGFTQTDEATYFYLKSYLAGGRTAPAAASTGSAQGDYVEWVQQNTTPVMKDSFSFVYDESMAHLNIDFTGKVDSGSGNTATMAIEIYDIDTTTVLLTTSLNWLAATDTTYKQRTAQLHLDTLTPGKKYKVRFMQSSGGSYNGTVRGDWVATTDQVIRTLR